MRGGLELTQAALARSDKAGGSAVDKLVAATRTYAGRLKGRWPALCHATLTGSPTVGLE